MKKIGIVLLISMLVLPIAVSANNNIEAMP